VAASVFVTVVAGLGELFVLSTKFAIDAQRRGQAAIAAQTKVEDLRSRLFGYDAAGDPITDSLLAPSPAGTLRAEVAGYFDALDSNAEVIHADDPGAGMFSRRWSIAPLDTQVPDALVIEVCVFREPARTAPLAAADLCLSTIRARQP
jgi:hypothetical protein